MVSILLFCINLMAQQLPFGYSATPVRTHSIGASLEIDVFDLKMMVKSGLEFFILKFSEPLQGCCWPSAKQSVQKG
jgi:hypothetical protein